MNESAILHYPESKYCFAVDSDTVCLRLRIDKSDVPERVAVIYGGKYSFALERQTAEMQRGYEDRLYAYYTVKLRLSDRRLVYVFSLLCGGKELYYSEDGLTETYDFAFSYYNCFQYAYINEADIAVPVRWMDKACFYQIFVDRFRTGNFDRDLSYVDLKCGEKPTPKSFAGGDLQGICDKLDYLERLGVNTLYLTPIFRSLSNHKYDIADYFSVDEAFGDKQTLRRLTDGAHARGMKIVLDAVFNHCSDSMKQFRDVLKNGKKSAYYDWFIFADGGTDEYECFSSCKYMPKFNTSNPEVQKFLIGVATYWMKECGIDGWRLDVSDEVSHDFWRMFRKEVKSINPDCVLIGENWHDANVYLRGDEFDGIMNYAFTKACLDFYAFGQLSPEGFAQRLNGLLMRNTDTANAMMLNLLDSHDTHRFLTMAGNDTDKLMSAVAAEFFFVGAPCLYYGTENAMTGGYDPDNRRCMDWTEAEKQTPLKDLIAALCKMKRDGLLSGTDIKIYENDGLVIFVRGACRLAVNESGEAKKYIADRVICANRYNGGVLETGGFAADRINGR